MENMNHKKVEEEKKNEATDSQQTPGQGEEEEFITNWEETVENFDDMGLKEGVLRGIYGYGFVKPSPIQQKGILPVIQGKDTIAQA